MEQHVCSLLLLQAREATMVQHPWWSFTTIWNCSILTHWKPHYSILLLGLWLSFTCERSMRAAGADNDHIIVLHQSHSASELCRSRAGGASGCTLYTLAKFWLQEDMYKLIGQTYNGGKSWGRRCGQVYRIGICWWFPVQHGLHKHLSYSVWITRRCHQGTLYQIHHILSAQPNLQQQNAYLENDAF